ncbi:MAG: hypothetical protein HJJLKODD_01200 [Phycisphaerae bacterium]|nr:hypothetical protein [Phycisphaerae bacterium]
MATNLRGLKLQINRETIRVLADRSLQDAAGGTSSLSLIQTAPCATMMTGCCQSITLPRPIAIPQPVSLISVSVTLPICPSFQCTAGCSVTVPSSVISAVPNPQPAQRPMYV